MSPKLLIADDEQKSVVPLTAILEAEGYTVESAVDGQKALDLLTGSGGDAYAVVLADQNMPKLDGMSLLTELRQRKHQAQVIMITGAGSVDLAVEAMRQGAYDFLEKPINLAKLKALIPKALERAQLQQKNEELETKLETLTRFGEMVGQSEPMQAVYQMIDRVAPSMASVLILGESGTGKELVAKALHKKSDRARNVFYPLNCAALPKEILENLLFGHEKGAFTGSTNEKPGAFEEASGGTIFLDEVAEMPPDIQVKLLRALESRMVRRLGGKKEIPVDIRIVAATNKDLQKAIIDGELREDLFYRLAVVEIDLPPLRERGADVQLIAKEFLATFAKQNGKKLDGFDDAALDWINSYSWPGNVRELRNAVEKAVIMTRGPKVTVDDLVSRRHRLVADANTTNTTITVTLGPNSLPEARRQIVVKALAAASGNLERAAREAGLTVAEVRNELLAMLERRGGGPGDAPDDGPPPDGGATDSVAPHGAAPHGAALNGAALNGAALNGAALNGAAPDAAAMNGAAAHGVVPLPPPVVLPDDAPSPVGKLTKAPVAARGRKSS